MTRPTRESRGGTFRADIEGLRGVAVLVVVAFHAGLPLFGGGFVGVDVFFVISGFLITRILFDESTQGHVRLVDFWARRIRRLVPALTVVVVATLLLSLAVFSPIAWSTIAAEARASSLYYSNLLFARSATSYFALPLERSPYLHTWSLGVEEQFYLAWPLLFFGLAIVARRWRSAARTRVLGVLTVVAAVSFGLSLWLTGHDQPWAFFSSPTRAWEFALGGIAAIGLTDLAARSRRTDVIGWLGLLAILVAVVRFDDFTLYPGLAALLPVLGAVALLAAGGTDGRLSPDRLLGWSPVVWLGGLSYTWYLWHWPLIVFAAAAFPTSGIALRSAAAVLALALAWLTTYFVENPVRFRSPFTRSRGFTYLGGAMATLVAVVASVGIVQVAERRQQSDPVLAELASARADKAGITPPSCAGPKWSADEPCVSGDVHSTNTVMLIGDSHAAQWRPALDQVAKDLQVRVVMQTFGGCAATDVPTAIEGTHELRDGCAEHRAQTAELIDEIRPDAVIVTHGDYLGGILDEHGAVGTDEQQRERWNAGLRDLATDLGRRDIPLGVILDSPTLDHDPVECVAKGRAGEECEASADRLDQLARRDSGERDASDNRRPRRRVRPVAAAVYRPHVPPLER